MSGELSLSKQHSRFWQVAILIGLTLAVTGLVTVSEVTCNQSLAVVFSLAVLNLWFYDKFSGTVSGILFFLTKSFWVRLTYAIDIQIAGTGGFDLLGITPALLLAGLTVLQLYSQLAAGEKICPDKTRRLLAAFGILSFLSIFNPANSPTIGLAGFERNILPNMTMLYLLASVVTERKHLILLVKVFLVLGIISCAYAIGQYFEGIYPWEIDSFRQLAFNEGLSGRLTIGLRGVEFRIFSIFYGYMDFFFTNILIFALALTYKDDLDGRWGNLRILYFILWTIILLLSLERMPLVMTLVVMMVLRFLGASSQKRRKMIWRSITIAGVIYGTLLLAGPYLESTGAVKLIRLAELANPFSATSINDRAETKWGPALETIKSNPLGVGIGYGSQTIARDEAIKSGLYAQPHNEFIQKTLETGYLGGLLYLLVLISVFKDFLKTSKVNSNGRSFGFAMAAGTVAFWLCGLVNLPFSGSSGLVYWSLAGATIAMCNIHNYMPNMANKNLESTDKNIEAIQNETCPLAARTAE